MKLSFVFVCQQGELEIKALLLAASLRRMLGAGVELIAALPQPESRWGRPGPLTLDVLRALGARTATIENQVDEDYPIGNKLSCLGVETAADVVVFLDSDMLCLRPIPHDSFGAEGAVWVKPADLATGGSETGRWEPIYRACGLEMPDLRVHATLTGAAMPPYFNAGLVATRQARKLAQAWLACARRLDADPSIDAKRPWLDQLALPAALCQAGLHFVCLDERWNFPAHFKSLDPRHPPYFMHYHWPEVLRREPAANALVAALCEACPALRTALQQQGGAWTALLHPYAALPAPRWPDRQRARLQRAGRGRDFFITGLPRSGTSYLCSLFNRLRDCVVINEPSQIFAPLAGEPRPWGVALYYGEVRRAVRDGMAVENKLRNGEFIEDTALGDGVELYHPHITRPDFSLASKNTLAYLARIAELRQVMPDAPVIACVRNPFDTIASWKTTFGHLAGAEVENFPVGGLNDPLLRPAARQRLAEIAGTGNLALRRALLWRHLAELIAEERDRVILLRYEDLVANPEGTLRELARRVAPGLPFRLKQPIRPTTARSKRDLLDADDLQAIRAVCGESAARLGYG